jgi:hypothetical protein
MMRKSIQLAMIATALVAGCKSSRHDAEDVAVEVVGGPASEGAAGTVPSSDFDLQATAALVRDGRVKDGAALELAVNGTRHHVDVDHDGKRDRLQVVEARDGDERTFTIRAIPTSKRRSDPDDVAVPIATIEVVAAGSVAHVTVAYAPIVVIASPVVITFDAPVAIDTFCYWVLVVDRPIFIGVAYVIIEDHVEHHKHKKHKKW